MTTYHDRVQALARLLVLESGHPHKQMYEVVGPRQPVVTTNRDLYLHVLALGDHLAVTGRRCWTTCARSGRSAGRWPSMTNSTATSSSPCSSRRPPRSRSAPSPSWRVDDFTTDGPYLGFTDFTKVLCTQIADLLAFHETPPGPFAAFGVDAPPRA